MRFAFEPSFQRTEQTSRGDGAGRLAELAYPGQIAQMPASVAPFERPQISADAVLRLGWRPDLPDRRDWSMERMRQASAPWTTSANQSASLMQRQARSRAAHQKWQGRIQAALGPGRDQLLLEAPPSQPLPRVDLRQFMSPVEDQGNVGSCTAQSVAGLIEYLQVASKGEYIDMSRLFLYKATRDLLQWTGDTGAYIRSTIKAVSLFGVCPESHWPHDLTRFDVEPPAFCYAFGGNYKSLSYYRLGGLDEIKQTLSQGYPAAFGFTCFQSLWNQNVSQTGYIPYPAADERAVGGHAVLAVGYVDTDQQDAGGGLVIIRNSWGSNWGQRGYGFLPYAYFHGGHNTAEMPPLADDYWTITGIDFSSLQGGMAPEAFTAGQIAHDRFYQFAERDRAALAGIF